MMKYIIIIISILISINICAQDINRVNKAALEELLVSIKQNRKVSNQRIQQYLINKNIDIEQFNDQNNTYRIIDIVDGIPKFYATHNSGAVGSVGVDQMREGGSLDIDITGVNASIAVWDSNLPRETHQEFGDRINNRNSMTAISDHSTHVTGTIIGNGTNPNARGFCYNADITAFDWINDTEEMVIEALSKEHLVSNHSYGVPGGWVGDVWRGDVSISDQEDYRFGFYDSDASTFDAIAYSAPYYTIVTSAGNDRNNVGDGSFPPDGPFDCISGFGTSKNVITVGAVNKLGAPYSDPSDIGMSNFSSWGPLDDGRIKPDIVAPGVAILSSVSDNDSAYALQNGTSMASPCVTGTVALLNELYFSLNNRYLTSASLKALLIHTAYESGISSGPDYSFGYGMINAEKASSLIINEDGTNNIIIENTLQSGETIDVELSPIPDKKMTITITWTDPAGTPTTRSLDPTDLMLVNDLDIQLIDEQGEITLPWILNPADPDDSATRGNNFRDNIEKIELESPKQLLYTLRISHKDELQSGQQNFSLIIDYESEEDSAERLFWVGGDGSWSDGSHWSLNSGGSPINRIPTDNSKVIFDDNSFPNGNGIALMDNDFSITSLLGLSDSDVSIDLSSNDMTISGPVIFSSPNYVISDGGVVFENEVIDKVSVINVNNTLLSNVSFSVSGANMGDWNLSSQDLELNKLQLEGGGLSVSDCNIIANDISLSGNSAVSSLNIKNSSFTFSENLTISSGLQFIESGSNAFQSMANSNANITIDVDVQSEIIIEKCDAVILSSGGIINKLSLIESNVDFNSDINISQLVVDGPSSIMINEAAAVSLSNLEFNTSPSMEVTISGTSPSERGSIFIEGRSKFCYDYLIIENVDLNGQNSVSVGENSSISNADNWVLGTCNSLLFADFSQEYLCEEGLSFFEDISDGDIIDREWYVDGEVVFGKEILYYNFTDIGTFDITLVITDTNGNQSEFTNTIEITPNNLSQNNVIQNSTQLASQQLATSYQWFNYGEPIVGEDQRTYFYNGNPGIYWVLTFDGTCNRLSSILDLGTSTYDAIDESIIVAPNPFSELLHIQSKNDEKWESLRVYNTHGELIDHYNNVNNIKINTSHWSSGIYLLSIIRDSRLETYKISKYE